MQVNYTRTNPLSKIIMKLPRKKLCGLVEELDADELRELTKIDEPQTFKVGEEDLPFEVVKKLGL